MAAEFNRIKRAAIRAEQRAWKAVRTATKMRNPLGRGAIRSGRVAAAYFERAKQLLLYFEMRRECAAEKRKRLKAATSEFNKTWDRGKRRA